MKTLLFLLLSSILLIAESLPFNLTYPSVTKSSKIKEQSYDRLNVYIKGEGNKRLYGHIWEQDFKYPKFENGTYKKALKDFMAKSLNIKPAEFGSSDYAHFKVNDKEYWIQLSLLNLL